MAALGSSLLENLSAGCRTVSSLWGSGKVSLISQFRVHITMVTANKLFYI